MHFEPRVRVADVMTGEVATVPPGASVKEIARQIAEKRVSALPVVDVAGQVLGVVSEADLLLKEGRGEPPRRSHLFGSRQSRVESAKAHGFTAADLMTSPALTVAPEAPLTDAARLMREHGVKRLVVVDQKAKLVGIISRGDVIRVFLRPDGDIRRAVVNGLAESLLWLDIRDLEVTVEEGVVRLDGRLDRRGDVELLARLTLDIDGVVGVINHLDFAWDDRRAARATALSPDLVTTSWS